MNPSYVHSENALFESFSCSLCLFGTLARCAKATAHAEWDTLATYSWKPPSPPVPMTQRRILRHNAIEAWNTLKKRGWRPCHPLVR